MKKSIVAGISILLFFSASAALADSWLPTPARFADSTWTGTLKSVDAGGAVTSLTATLAIGRQTDNFFSGSLTLAGTSSTAVVDLTGVVGPFNPYFFQATAANMVLFADEVKFPHANKLVVRISDTATGSTLMGVLTRQ